MSAGKVSSKGPALPSALGDGAWGGGSTGSASVRLRTGVATGATPEVAFLDFSSWADEIDRERERGKLIYYIINTIGLLYQYNVTARFAKLIL